MSDRSIIDVLPNEADVLAMQNVLDRVCASESPLREDHAMAQALAAWSASAGSCVSGLIVDASGSYPISIPRIYGSSNDKADLSFL